MRKISSVDFVPSRNHNGALCFFLCVYLCVLEGCAPPITKIDIEGDSLDARNVRSLATYMKAPGLTVCSTEYTSGKTETKVSTNSSGGHLEAAWKIGYNNEPGKEHYKLLMSFPCGQEYYFNIGE